MIVTNNNTKISTDKALPPVNYSDIRRLIDKNEAGESLQTLEESLLSPPAVSQFGGTAYYVTRHGLVVLQQDLEGVNVEPLLPVRDVHGGHLLPEVVKF